MWRHTGACINMYGFDKRELEGLLDSDNPCSKNVYFKQWNNGGSICLCFRIMLSGLTVPDGLFTSYEWKEMSVSSPKLEFPSLRHFWHENNEDAEMKVTYRTFIRFHTRCTKNKPDRVSQEIAARKRWKRRNIWDLYSCCRNMQSYLPLHRVPREEEFPKRNHSPPGSHLLLYPLLCAAGLSSVPVLCRYWRKGYFISAWIFLWRAKWNWKNVPSWQIPKMLLVYVFSPAPGQKKCVFFFF